MDEKEVNSRSITLLDIWNIFLKAVIWMVLAAVVTVGVFVAAVTVTYTPEYKSTATLYVLKQQNEQDAATLSDFALALNVVNDCTHILKSRTVIDETIKELGYDISYNALSRNITTNNPSNTRILEVSVVADTPLHAKMLVDKICEIGSEEIERAMSFKQTNLFEKGQINDAPCNKTPITTYLIAGIAAAAIVYAIFFIAFMLDDSIRTNEDIEHCFGLPILAEIPDINEAINAKNNYGKYGRYGKYGKNYYKKTGEYGGKN